MKITPCDLSGLLLLEPQVFADERGFFLETARENVLREAGIPPLVQDNQSRSQQGVLRGLHFQRLHPQGKLVRVAHGAILDVAVDIRRGSPTFGQWRAFRLDDRLHQQLYIPPDFAHGFVVCSESADVVYRCSDYYHPNSEGGIAYDDPQLAIPWRELCGHERDWILSNKDQNWKPLNDTVNLPEYHGVP